MIRTTLLPALAAACVFVPRAAADDLPTLKEALALQDAMEKAIQDAEPSVACVLVSRSNAYQRWFGERRHPDSPGRLGRFNPQTAPVRVPAEDLPAGQAGEDAYLAWLHRHVPRDLEPPRGPPPRDERLQLELLVKQRYDLADRANVPESFGSAVVIDRDGLLLTCYHVVKGATKVYVRLEDGTGSYADIHAADSRSDLAVLRLLDAHPLKPIAFGDGGKVRKGQWVLALANPYAAGFRDGSPSASWGIVSNLRRRAPGKRALEERQKTLYRYGTLIQTDARLPLGCSGGALINLRGELIGITTALAALTGAETAGGFAVPLDDRMKRIIEVLRRGQEVEYGFLGVGTQDAPRGEEGILILSTAVGSPAQRAGLTRNDRLLAVNGTPVHEPEDLFLAIGGCLAGSAVVLKVQGRFQTIPVSLAKLYVPGPIIAANQPEPFRGLRVDHGSVWYQRLSLFEQQFQHIPPGVMIREVQSDSPAAAAGLKVDDVITEVNGQPVGSPADFYAIVRGLKGPVDLTLRSPEGAAHTVRID